MQARVKNNKREKYQDNYFFLLQTSLNGYKNDPLIMTG